MSLSSIYALPARAIPGNEERFETLNQTCSDSLPTSSPNLGFSKCSLKGWPRRVSPSGSPLYYTDARAKLRLTKPSRQHFKGSVNRPTRLRKHADLAHPSLNTALPPFDLFGLVGLRKERQHVTNSFSSPPFDVVRADFGHGIGPCWFPNRVRKSSRKQRDARGRHRRRWRRGRRGADWRQGTPSARRADRRGGGRGRRVSRGRELGQDHRQEVRRSQAG